MGRPSVAPRPGQDPFARGAPEPFLGPLWFFNFTHLPSSGSLAVVDHVALKSAPMVGGGPLPCGRGRSLVEVEIVERPMCLKIGGGVVLKSLFFCQIRFFVGLAGCGFGATIGRPSPWPGPFLPWDPPTFCGPLLVFNFPPPHSSGSLAVIDHVALKSVPMVRGGPLPRGRGVEVEIVERPTCLKFGGGVVFKPVFFAKYGLLSVWQGGDLGRPLVAPPP